MTNDYLINNRKLLFKCSTEHLKNVFFLQDFDGVLLNSIVLGVISLIVLIFPDLSA